MGFWAAALPILKAVGAAAASGAAGAAVKKAGDKKNLPPVTGGAPMMQPVPGSQQDEMVKAILMQNLKDQTEKGEALENEVEALEEQAKAVAKDVAEATKR